MNYWQNHDPLQQRVADVTQALAQVEALKKRPDDVDTGAAERELQSAIDLAREAGVTWGAIGDAMGLTRGNAYQRYRQRSGPV